MDDNTNAVAWAAGLFEGEGSIMMNKYDGHWRRGLRMSMTDEDVVRRFAAVVGVGQVHGPIVQNPKHKPAWRWHSHSWPDIVLVLNAFMPYFGERRRGKAIILLMNPAKPRGGKTQTHCKRGHELTEENTYKYASGSRYCRTCHRMRAAGTI